jgi:outer membrane protein TolC
MHFKSFFQETTIMQLKRALLAILTVGTASLAAIAQVPTFEGTVSLDSCRAMALANNKQLRMQSERIKAAGYQKKEAFAAYLPGIDFAGGYIYNQKNLSVFDSDQYLPTMSFDMSTQSYKYNLVTNPVTGEPITSASGQYVPSTVALIPKDALTFDIHNVFFGAVTLTQPIYMGGKIVAMNKIAGFAEDLARSMHNSQAEDLIYAVDGAYWQVVSLKAKQRLTTSYVALLDSLQHNVEVMVREGVATRSDLLSVDVKLNQAQVDQTKVENGLALSRMALAQVCGLPVNTVMTLADEDSELVSTQAPIASRYNMQDVYSNRSDLHSLELGVKIKEQQAKVALSSMLPNVALIGSYSFSNPNMYNGFSKNVNGAFSVGAMVTIPLWHWGGNYNKYRAAKAETTVMKLQLDDVKEKIDLQVSQASFKAQEAVKTYQMTLINLEKAEENLRTAQVGFKEGVIPTDNVMAAQTAWLKAQSEKIDAEIDVHLCDVYLSKVLGKLSYVAE